MSQTNKRIKYISPSGTEEYIILYDNVSDLKSNDYIQISDRNNNYYIGLSEENDVDNSELKVEKDNKLYNILKQVIKALKLTKDYYHMQGIYPDTYQTMTEVPDELDISNVTNIHDMFNGCKSLITIPKLNTSNVTNMDSMFAYCTSLTSIPQLDTSNVTNMYSMFVNCRSLTTIPQLDIDKVTDMRDMFRGCTSLTSIPELDTSNVTSMTNMFNSCTSLPSEFPWIINCNSIRLWVYIQDMFKNSSVTKVKLANVNESIKSEITSQLLKGDDTLTIEFV